MRVTISFEVEEDSVKASRPHPEIGALVACELTSGQVAVYEAAYLACLQHLNDMGFVAAIQAGELSPEIVAAVKAEMAT